MEKCSTTECKRVAVPDLDGMCLGCFHNFVFAPARDEFNKRKDQLTATLVKTPVDEFHAMVHESSKYTRSV